MTPHAVRKRLSPAVAPAAVLVGGTLLAAWLAVRTDGQLREDLLGQTRVLAEAVNLERVRALTGTEADLDAPEYRRLKAQLAAVRAADPKCRFVYLMGRTAGGTVFFFADSEPAGSKDESPAGQEYDDASAECIKIFDSGTPFVEGPLPDEWGTWVSAMVPLTDPKTGQLIAVLGMDIDARDWQWVVAARAVLPVGLATLALIAIILTGSMLLDWRARLEGPPPRWMGRLEPVLTVAVGLVLSLLAARLAQDESGTNRARFFRHLAESRTAAVAQTFRDLQDVELEGLARFHEGSEEVTAEEFRHYADHLTRNGTVRAWEWVPVVAACEKECFEQAARAAGMDGFEIWQRDAVGRRVPATGREVYYPVFRAVPPAANQNVIGFDLGSEPVRHAALEEALRTGLITATEPMTPVPETGGQREMLVFRPVFADAQRNDPRGLALAVVRLGDVLAETAPDAVVAEQLLLAHGGALPEPLASSWTADSPPRATLITHRPVLAFGKTFLVAAHAGPEFLRRHPGRGEPDRGTDGTAAHRRGDRRRVGAAAPAPSARRAGTGADLRPARQPGASLGHAAVDWRRRDRLRPCGAGCEPQQRG